MEIPRWQNLACFAEIRVACFVAIRDRASWLWQRLNAWFFDIQGDRLILWTPVCFGVGVGVYFYLPREPSIFELFLVLILPMAAIFVPRPSDLLRILQAAALMTAAGLAVAGASSRWQASSMLDRPLPAIELSGWLSGIDRGASGQRRMILTGIQSETDRELPSGLRLTLPNGMDEPDVGSFIRLRAKLYPIPPPAWVNGYDQQRALFFRGIGGLGEALEPPVVAIPAKSWSLASQRRTITARILAIDRGQAGALAVALTVGDRSLISPETDRAMRDSGLAHLLSISGLHIGLVALLVMGVVRRGGALWPWLALRFHLKKWSAGAAILAAGFYSALAGWDVPVQRSFLSILVILAAVIADRNPISLRPVAAAALAVLVVAPDALLGASFQMSFAAVIMLIGGYERGWIKLARWRVDGIGGWLLLWLAGTVASSLLATAATLPYAAYHFHRIALYGVISNILAIPLSGIVIMPMAVVALLAMPFGLEAAPLAGMMAGLDALLIMATSIARWPGSSLAVAEMGDISLILFSLSGLWLCLWRGWAAAFLAAGMTLLALGLWWRHPVPDAMIGARRGIAGINTGKAIFIPGAKPAGLLPEIWRDLTGGLALTTDSPPPGSDFGDRRFGCRRDLCLLERYGRTLALPLTRAGAIAACGRHDLLLIRDFWPECSSSWRIVSPSPVGAAGVYLTPGGIAIATDRQRRGNRLWVALPHKPAERDRNEDQYRR